MFRKILAYPKFWKSVIVLSFTFGCLFVFLKWILDDFNFAFFTGEQGTRNILVMILASFIYGFFVTYGKFWRKLKENTNS